jgi:hypothetical protein
MFVGAGIGANDGGCASLAATGRTTAGLPFGAGFGVCAIALTAISREVAIVHFQFIMMFPLNPQ